MNDEKKTIRRTSGEKKNDEKNYASIPHQLFMWGAMKKLEKRQKGVHLTFSLRISNFKAGADTVEM